MSCPHLARPAQCETIGTRCLLNGGKWREAITVHAPVNAGPCRTQLTQALRPQGAEQRDSIVAQHALQFGKQGVQIVTPLDCQAG